MRPSSAAASSARRPDRPGTQKGPRGLEALPGGRAPVQPFGFPSSRPLGPHEFVRSSRPLTARVSHVLTWREYLRLVSNPPARWSNTRPAEYVPPSPSPLRRCAKHDELGPCAVQRCAITTLSALPALSGTDPPPFAKLSFTPRVGGARAASWGQLGLSAGPPFPAPAGFSHAPRGVRRPTAVYCFWSPLVAPGPPGPSSLGLVALPLSPSSFLPFLSRPCGLASLPLFLPSFPPSRGRCTYRCWPFGLPSSGRTSAPYSCAALNLAPFSVGPSLPAACRSIDAVPRSAIFRGGGAGAGAGASSSAPHRALSPASSSLVHLSTSTFPPPPVRGAAGGFTRPLARFLGSAHTPGPPGPFQALLRLSERSGLDKPLT